VHDLGFTKALDPQELHILGETQWIEETEGCNSTGESVTGKRLIRYPSVDWSNNRNSRDFNSCKMGKEEVV